MNKTEEKADKCIQRGRAAMAIYIRSYHKTINVYASCIRTGMIICHQMLRNGENFGDALRAINETYEELLKEREKMIKAIADFDELVRDTEELKSNKRNIEPQTSTRKAEKNYARRSRSHAKS